MPTTKERMRRAAQRAAEFNRLHPVGTRVLYRWPGSGRELVTATRSPASSPMLSEPIVFVDEIAVPVGLDCLTVLPAASLVRE